MASRPGDQANPRQPTGQLSSQCRIRILVIPLDPYQYQKLGRIRNKCFQIQDQDPYQNDTDSQHC